MTSPAPSQTTPVPPLRSSQTFVSHLRYALSGTLGPAGAATEIWATRFHMGGATDTVSLPSDAVLAGDVAFIQAWFSRGDSHISSVAALTNITVSHIGQNGKTPTDAAGAFAQKKFPLTAPLKGGGGDGVLPFQIAAVLSLSTARSGPTGRGRMFVPTPNVPIATTGLVDAAYCQSMANSLTQLFTDLNSVPVGTSTPRGERVCVASGGSVKHAVAPANVPVTHVRCGRVLDTMRARRNGLPELYAVGASF